MNDNESKANNKNEGEKIDRSTRMLRTEMLPTNPPVPNRAHTEMKKGEKDKK